MTETITSHVTHCLELFRDGLPPMGRGDRDPSEETLIQKIRDEHTRFKVWSGNIGAHRVGMSSLDYRLRDSSHIRNHIIRLLKDLGLLLEDVRAILSGKKTPWDQLSSDEDSEVEDEEDSDTDDVTGSENDSADTELGQLTLNVTDVINCLLRMSITIRNPSRHDRFVGSVSTEMLHYEPFDIQHVGSMFYTIDSALAERLGKAITRRRQYFKYREAHHDKLSYGLEGRDHLDTAPETIASSIPEHLKDGQRAVTSTITKPDDGCSESGFSQTSYALTMANDDRRHIPPLPREASRGPFQCPFCFTIVVITNKLLWKKHVYGDLRPYVCLVKDCKTPNQEYTRQHEWMQHMVDNHWKIYRCPFTCDVTFASSPDCKNHIIRNHADMAPLDQVDDLVGLGAQRVDYLSGLSCPLCPETLGSIKQYQRHVGRHQEQLAIFALPNLSNEDHGNSDNEDFHDLSSSYSIESSSSQDGSPFLRASQGHDPRQDINSTLEDQNTVETNKRMELQLESAKSEFDAVKQELRDIWPGPLKNLEILITEAEAQHQELRHLFKQKELSRVQLDEIESRIFREKLALWNLRSITGSLKGNEGVYLGDTHDEKKQIDLEQERELDMEEWEKEKIEAEEAEEAERKERVDSIRHFATQDHPPSQGDPPSDDSDPVPEEKEISPDYSTNNYACTLCRITTGTINFERKEQLVQHLRVIHELSDDQIAKRLLTSRNRETVLSSTSSTSEVSLGMILTQIVGDVEIISRGQPTASERHSAQNDIEKWQWICCDCTFSTLSYTHNSSCVNCGHRRDQNCYVWAVA
ncbi:hypothetical protein F5Y03DRAFT_161128 [Xylaria venustula]|nr:hypothetical protein F5Y03DRAFT_161128 [Xylaria venustula]